MDEFFVGNFSTNFNDFHFQTHFFSVKYYCKDLFFYSQNETPTPLIIIFLLKKILKTKFISKKFVIISILSQIYSKLETCVIDPNFISDGTDLMLLEVYKRYPNVSRELIFRADDNIIQSKLIVEDLILKLNESKEINEKIEKLRISYYDLESNLFSNSFIMFTNLKVLELTSCTLDLDKLTKLFSSLIKPLEYLDLKNNYLRPETLPVFSKLDKRNLHYLNLSTNNLCETEFLSYISIDKFPVLNELNLYFNAMTLNDLKIMFPLEQSERAYSNLTTLNLKDNFFGDEGIRHLSNFKFPNLSNLQIEALNVSYEGLRSLSSWQTFNLKELNLSNNRISDKGIEKLADSEVCSNLVNLSLERSKISIIGMKSLSNGKLKNIKILNLDYTRISDQNSLKELAENNFTKIKELYLNSCNITDEGVEHLSKGNFNGLRVLSLGGNKISELGCKYLSASSIFTQLTTLNLNNNKINSQGTLRIANGKFFSLRHLDLSFNQIEFEGLCNIFSGNLNNLRTLILKNISDVGLFVDWNHHTEEQAKKFNLPKLVSLEISSNRIHHGVSQFLSACTFSDSFTSLDLSNNYIDEKSLKLLSQGNLSKTLINLKLCNNDVTDEGLRYLSENFTKLRKLSLMDVYCSKNAVDKYLINRGKKIDLCWSAKKIQDFSNHY